MEGGSGDNENNDYDDEHIKAHQEDIEEPESLKKHVKDFELKNL